MTTDRGAALRRSARALPHDRERRRRLCRRGAFLLAGIAALAATMALPCTPTLVWNASASVPIGLYLVTSDVQPIKRGDLTLVYFPSVARSLAARRHYLPRTVPALKYVEAVAGDTVCAREARVAIVGGSTVRRLATDELGRPLPWWLGCRELRPDQILLLNPASPASFDGRYFGVTEASAVIGKAHPLWTR